MTWDQPPAVAVKINLTTLRSLGRRRLWSKNNQPGAGREQFSSWSSWEPSRNVVEIPSNGSWVTSSSNVPP